MENKKIVTIVGGVILIIILGTVIYFFQKAEEVASPVKQQPAVVATQKQTAEELVVKPRENEPVAPTVEMGNAIGEVQSITSDSLTVKTDTETLALAIKGIFNVSAFTAKGSEQKSLSDVKVGSKVSVQYSKEKVVMSMYLMK